MYVHHRPPRYSSSVRFIQADVCPEELGQSRACSVALLGDLKITVSALAEELRGWRLDDACEWWNEIREKVRLNKVASRELYR